MSATRNYVLREVLAQIDPRTVELYRIFDAYNEAYFAGELPHDLPLLVVQVFPYGHCIGLTTYRRPMPVIEIGQRQLREGPEDVLLHEMLHAHLDLRGEDTKHNGAPWCRELERITPLYLGLDVKATPERTKRIDGRVTRWVPDGHLPRRMLARWPDSVRNAQLRVTSEQHA